REVCPTSARSSHCPWPARFASLSRHLAGHRRRGPRRWGVTCRTHTTAEALGGPRAPRPKTVGSHVPNNDDAERLTHARRRGLSRRRLIARGAGVTAAGVALLALTPATR